MYTLIIADDEFDIRKAIVKTIDWTALGFEIVGEAENGREAVELIEAKNPDVVITDIKMPFVDGIELTKSIRETNPMTKVVFLTGFDEFEYALSAIKLSVFEYLLKPISSKNLIETMTKIKLRLDEEIRQIHDVELLKETYNENMPLMRFELLVSLINNSNEIKNLGEKAERRGINLKGGTYTVFTVKLDKKSIQSSSLKTDDIELILISVRNMAKTIAKKYVSSEVFIYDENVVAIISDTKESIGQYSYILINELHQSIIKHYNILSAIGVSNPFSDLKNTHEAYQSSISALHYAFVSEDGGIIYIGDFEPRNAIMFLYDEARELRLQSIIKAGDIPTLDEFADEIFKEISDKKATLADCQICILGIFSDILKLAKTVMPDYEANIPGSLDFISEMYKKESLDEMKTWFSTVCKQIAEAIGTNRKDSSGILANEAYDYLKLNYSDPGISLKSVSERLFISPGYLSTAFKKETGETFSDCLIRLRMENAMELLQASGLKIFEISGRVGYTDQHYFSYCFKKYYGQSPNETRSKGVLRETRPDAQ